MGEESDQIKKHIGDMRDELGAHLNELEYRVKSAGEEHERVMRESELTKE